MMKRRIFCKASIELKCCSRTIRVVEFSVLIVNSEVCLVGYNYEKLHLLLMQHF